MIQAKFRGLIPCAHLPFIRLMRRPPRSAAVPRSPSPERRARGTRATPCTSAYIAVASEPSTRSSEPSSPTRRCDVERAEKRRDPAARARRPARLTRRAVRPRTASGSWPTATGKPVATSSSSRAEERQALRERLAEADARVDPDLVDTAFERGARALDEPPWTTDITSPSEGRPLRTMHRDPSRSGVGGDRPQRRRTCR